MKKALMYTKSYCPYCDLAKEILSQYPDKVLLEEVDVENDPKQLAVMMDKTKRRTVPQIFIEGQYIGGYDDLAEFEKTGKLNKLLEQ